MRLHVQLLFFFRPLFYINPLLQLLTLTFYHFSQHFSYYRGTHVACLNQCQVLPHFLCSVSYNLLM
jgi:hypothetical protein